MLRAIFARKGAKAQRSKNKNPERGAGRAVLYIFSYSPKFTENEVNLAPAEWEAQGLGDILNNLHGGHPILG